jgi:hypothetical protein
MSGFSLQYKAGPVLQVLFRKQTSTIAAGRQSNPFIIRPTEGRSPERRESCCSPSRRQDSTRPQMKLASKNDSRELYILTAV